MLLTTAGPFDFALTAEVLARLPRHNALERFHAAGSLRPAPAHQRALRLAGGPRVVTARPAPGGVELDSDDPVALQWARRSFGLELDPAPFEAAAAGDPALGPAVRRLRGLRPPLMDPWEAWVAAVLGQQVTLAFALQQIAAFSRRYGGEVEGELPDGTTESFPLHPTPEQTLEADEAGMLGCRVSRSKTSYLRALARATLDGALEGASGLPLEEALGRLTRVRGVGPWTARYWLLTVGRTDSLAYGDAGLAAAYKLAYGTLEGLQAWGERLGPSRGWAYYYLIWHTKYAREARTPSSAPSPRTTRPRSGGPRRP